MFIIRGFLSIANWEIHREYIKKSDPEIPGLTDDFIIKSKDLLDCCLLTKDDENLNKK
jgi:hypothetical protein